MLRPRRGSFALLVLLASSTGLSECARPGLQSGSSVIETAKALGENAMYEHKHAVLQSGTEAAVLFGTGYVDWSEAKAAMYADENSALSKLHSALLKPGAKVVVVGAGGTGKSETTELAMQDAKVTSYTFELFKEYLAKKAGVSYKKSQLKNLYRSGDPPDYNEYRKIKADQLTWLTEETNTEGTQLFKGIEAATEVLFLDEVDLVAKTPLEETEVSAISILLQEADKVDQGPDGKGLNRRRVVVLHPAASVDAHVREALLQHGYPGQPGSKNWVDFSTPFNDATQEAILEAILRRSFNGSDHTCATEGNLAYLKQELKGQPGAYLRLLIDKYGALTTVMSHFDCADRVAAIIRTVVGDKGAFTGWALYSIVHDGTTPGARDIIAKALKGQLTEADKTGDAFFVAQASGVMLGDGTVSDIMRRALAEFCNAPPGGALTVSDNDLSAVCRALE